MDRRKMNDTVPSAPVGAGKKTLNIEIGFLVKIIVLFFMMLIILGCAADKHTTKTAYCHDGFQTTTGWISAESSQSYWVVGQDGKLMEYNKRYCSIRG